jgi:3-hydroxyisobutyrate dehydrogenase
MAICFLGMGILGSNFTRALLSKGQSVHVWNRTLAKARLLEACGARVFDRVTDAVAGCDRIHLTLGGDQSVDEVLQAAFPGFKKGVMIIDHSTTSVEGAAYRSRYWKEKGYRYIHAPVFMGGTNALESTGTMLISGDPDVINRLQPELSAMTGKLWNLGEQPQKAAAMKLVGNVFFLGLFGCLSDLHTLGHSLQVPLEAMLEMIGGFDTQVITQNRLKRIGSNDFDTPLWQLAMARKDAQLMLDQCARTHNELMTIPGIATRMDRWIAKGFGHKDWCIASQPV